MHVVSKTNEINTKNKFFKKAGCRCNEKVITMHLFITKCILLYTYSSDQAKNVLNMTKLLNKKK